MSKRMFPRIFTRPVGLHDLDIKPTVKWKLEGLKLVSFKWCTSKILGGQRGSILKNSTSSPMKRLKTTSSATFCATGVWELSKKDTWNRKYLEGRLFSSNINNALILIWKKYHVPWSEFFISRKYEVLCRWLCVGHYHSPRSRIISCRTTWTH